jgi:hypothetical protein
MHQKRRHVHLYTEGNVCTRQTVIEFAEPATESIPKKSFVLKSTFINTLNFGVDSWFKNHRRATATTTGTLKSLVIK